MGIFNQIGMGIENRLHSKPVELLSTEQSKLLENTTLTLERQIADATAEMKQRQSELEKLTQLIEDGKIPMDGYMLNGAMALIEDARRKKEELESKRKI